MEDPRGCYVLLDGGRPVYVGISKHVLTRLQEHVRGTDHFTATLAYRIAAFRHPHGKTAATAMRDEDFRSRFEESQRQLQELSVAFVAIENPLVLYLFEPYCALDLDTARWISTQGSKRAADVVPALAVACRALPR